MAKLVKYLLQLNMSGQDIKKNNIFIENNDGYIALISAIIITLILVTITLILNLGGFLGRFNILDGEYKETSIGLAEACVDSAILQITKGVIPASCTKIMVGSNFCNIISVTGSNPAIIKTQAEYKKSYTNLIVAIDSSGTINYWKEYPYQAICP